MSIIGHDGFCLVRTARNHSFVKPYLQMKKSEKYQEQTKTLKESTNCLLTKGNTPKSARKNDIHNGRYTQKRFLTVFTHGLKR